MGKYLRRSCVTEEHRFAEYFIDIVGPPLHLAEPLLESALNLHFKSRKWHFYTKTAADWVKADSKVIANLKKIKAKFPFTAMVCIFCLIKYLLKRFISSLTQIKSINREFQDISTLKYLFQFTFVNVNFEKHYILLLFG